jgi:RNA polymerase primary sigma factor
MPVIIDKRLKTKRLRHLLRRTCEAAGPVPDELREPIPFVAHPVFRRKDAEQTLKRIAPFPEIDAAAVPNSQPGLTFVAGFVSQPLLAPAQEEALFAWMNFHRFRAEQFRRRALAAKSPRSLIARMRRELTCAAKLRNQIVSSNLRLVVSLAKTLARSLDQMSELIGDGVLPLIRAVELFDISLGNRFSTYATWAVRNKMLRVIQRSKLISAPFGPPLALDSLPDRPAQREDDDILGASAARVERLLADLPQRERTVLAARFGLAGEPAGQSLTDVAKRVGLGKERVRQIVLKSLDELRGRFADFQKVGFAESLDEANH